MEDAIENIDIGGPSMLQQRRQELPRRDGGMRPAGLRTGARRDTRGRQYPLRNAAHAFGQGIYPYGAVRCLHCDLPAGKSRSAGEALLDFDIVQPLRYGENPHQQAKFYRGAEPGALLPGVRPPAQRQGAHPIIIYRMPMRRSISFGSSMRRFAWGSST